MEFYFGDQLRWSFGFDNPNKAGALLATLLPLLWICAAAAWDARGRCWRAIAVAGASIALVTGWWLLFMTYSRGAIVAAAAAFAYIGFRTSCELFTKAARGRQMVALGTLAAIGSLFLLSAAAKRSVGWIARKEGSVENRLTLWKGGLAMLGDNPLGVGAGNSGEAYMRWYQPIEMTARYRTMVNSPLTFAVERGLPALALAAAAAAAFWMWTGTANRRPQSIRDRTVIGLRSCLIGFAVAGLFSTTMEQWQLWVAPVATATALLFFGLRDSSWARLGRALTRSAVGTAAASLLLYGTAMATALSYPIRIVLDGGSPDRAQLHLRGKKANRAIAVMVDETVLGRDWGKLVRRLAAGTGMTIWVNPNANAVAECWMLAGKAVHAKAGMGGKNIILLAPARLEEAEARALIQDARRAAVCVPEIDEDGRAALWSDVGAAFPNVPVTVLSNVGTDVSSAWPQIIEIVAKKSAILNGQSRSASVPGGSLSDLCLLSRGDGSEALQRCVTRPKLRPKHTPEASLRSFA